ncbi:MAG: hypothetical protein ABSH42_02560 [Bryobacteraceae bacterium]|jgi:hypothetical protein
MKRVLGVAICLMAGWLAIAADSPDRPKTQSSPAPVPPVLRNQDAEQDDVIVLLPGAPVKKTEAVKPAPAVGSAPAESAKPSLPAAAGDAPHASTKVVYPPAFEQNSALFCQKMIGQWTADDARFLLGQPLRQRPAYGDNQSVNGQIFAFPDPTGRYKELELDFESGSGLLRTVFVYPLNMTWQDCRRQWGGEVSATEAAKGRKFYSYVDRRLDVLVDSAGKVISLGLY